MTCHSKFSGEQKLTVYHQTHCMSVLLHEVIPCVCAAVPRGGPRNMRVFDATTNTLTIGWDHAEGPVRQYRIAYAPMTGDPITEFVSSLQTK